MTKIAIVGYGNLGKACERIAVSRSDMEIAGIFSRRDPNKLASPFGTPFYAQKDIESFEGKVDVVCICTGSAHDVTGLGVRLANSFNTVDSFDTHAAMSDYFRDMDAAAMNSGHLSFVGIGWDPGLFSLMRALFCGVLRDGDTQTFWGKGVSQGHSEAIRRIDGVADARQYTVPKGEALELARAGRGSGLGVRDMHMRECYVVVEAGADKARIEREIKEMPNYFAPYDTIVHFIDKEEFEANHSAMPHAGVVLRSGKINGEASNLEFSLNLQSNPDFTASVMLAYANANAKMARSGLSGAMSILDIPVAALIDLKRDEYICKFV